jgi:hypothetical protein
MNKLHIIRNRSDFHKRRSKTIGSSDIPVLFGLVKQYKTAYDLWKEMTGRMPGANSDNQQSAPAALGHAIEGIILSRQIEELSDRETAHKFRVDYYQHEDSRPTDWKPATEFIPFSFSVYPDDNRFTASPDCVRIGDDELIIEAKLGSRFANLRSSKKEDGYDLDDPTENGLPLRVYLQCQWQALVCGIDNIIVRALIDSVFEAQYTFKSNIAIQNKLVEAADKFLNLVKADKPPAPQNFNDIKGIYDDVRDDVLIIGGQGAEEAEQLFNDKQRWKQVEKEAKESIEDIKSALAVIMGDKRYLQSTTGKKLATQVITDPMWFNIGINKIYQDSPEAFAILKADGLIPEKKAKRYII